MLQTLASGVWVVVGVSSGSKCYLTGNLTIIPNLYLIYATGVCEKRYARFWANVRIFFSLIKIWSYSYALFYIFSVLTDGFYHEIL